MGPWAATLTGLAENMEYILTRFWPRIVVGAGGYLGAIFGIGPPAWEPVWWLACYGFFVGPNIRGWRWPFASRWW